MRPTSRAPISDRRARPHVPLAHWTRTAYTDTFDQVGPRVHWRKTLTSASDFVSAFGPCRQVCAAAYCCSWENIIGVRHRCEHTGRANRMPNPTRSRGILGKPMEEQDCAWLIPFLIFAAELWTCGVQIRDGTNALGRSRTALCPSHLLEHAFRKRLVARRSESFELCRHLAALMGD
eukprot:1932076-Prymnesium_polylepis.2